MTEPGELIRETFETSPVGFAVVDPGGRVLAANLSLRYLNGSGGSDPVGRTVAEVLPLLETAIEEAVRSVVESGGPAPRVEARVADPSRRGAVRTFALEAWPLGGGGPGSPIALAVTDRSEQRRVEDALRRSEAQFRAICEASPVGIFLTDPRGANLYANPVHVAQLGLSAEECRGFGWQRAVHPDELPATRELYSRAVQRGEVYRGVSRLVHADGRIVTVDVRTTAVIQDGKILGYVGMAEDISDRRKAEAALRESELRFRQLAENIASAFWLAPADRSALYYLSPAFEQIWGVPVADVLENRDLFVELLHPDDRERVLARLAEVASAPYEHEYRVVRPDGTTVWVHDRGFPVRDESGNVVRLAGIATDVTERKALEAKVLQAEKLDSIGRLAGGIAHDFNNLLTVILNQVTMAIRTADQGVAPKEELTQIQEAAAHAADLTRQLLAFARRQPWHPSPLGLGDLVSAVVRFLRRVLGGRIELVVAEDGDLGIVRADRAQVEQVVVNLALNARDAMPDGGTLTIATRNARVDVASESLPAGSYVVLSVTDTGRGIAEKHRPHIFDPFFSTKPPGEGTGLGLASCYGIVKQHGGHIVVESTPGEGTCMKVYFPRIDGIEEPTERAPQDPSRAARGSECVLLVEDDPVVRAIAARALREHGYRALEASDAVSALAVFEVHGKSVDIVVTDVVMPGMSGAELGAALQQRHPALPVLYTSGYPQRGGDDDRALRGPLLAKPYLGADLAHAVRATLDGAR